MRYIFLFLWFLLGLVYYMVSKKYCCNPVPVESSTIITTPCPTAGPLTFQWTAATPDLSSDWESIRTTLTSELLENQKLQITGLQRTGEPKDGEDLGMARAREVAKLFTGLDEKLQLESKTVDKGKESNDCAFNGVSFRKIVVSEKIQEIDDRTLIYFPFDSNQKLADREIENYLIKVAERVKKSGERILLTGHTDNFGTPAYNLSLGQSRADIIKVYLQKRGVSPAKITATSKGETAPIASNDTEGGMAKNRRTELQILK